MRLKNLNESPFGGFTFFYWDPQKVYQQVKGNSIENLTTKSALQMRNQGMKVPENLREIIEHQICVNQPNPASSCWSSGLGDVIHKDIVGPVADAVAKVAKKIGLPKVAKAVKKASRCGSCGGSKVYTEGKNNLGRAGTLNKLFTIPSQRR